MLLKGSTSVQTSKQPKNTNTFQIIRFKLISGYSCLSLRPGFPHPCYWPPEATSIDVLYYKLLFPHFYWYLTNQGKRHGYPLMPQIAKLVPTPQFHSAPVVNTADYPIFQTLNLHFSRIGWQAHTASSCCVGESIWSARILFELWWRLAPPEGSMGCSASRRRTEEWQPRGHSAAGGGDAQAR